MFGKSKTSTSTSKISRPEYYTQMLNALSNDINNTPDLAYTNRQYAGLNDQQNDAIAQLMASPELRSMYSQYYNSGQEGLSNIDDAYNQLMGIDGYTTADVENVANQFYNQSDVDAAIAAQNQQIEEQLGTQVNPQIAQQTYAFGGQGFGSGIRMAKDMAKANAIQQGQSAANDITNQAYNSAMNQASSLLSSNQANKVNALSGLLNTGFGQAANLNTAAGYANQANTNALYAGNLQQQNQQNMLDNQYANDIAQQNIGWQDVQNRINAASVLNGGYGQTQTVKTTGGGGMLGGMASGAAAGFMAGGPWGALAGAAIGAAAS